MSDGAAQSPVVRAMVPTDLKQIVSIDIKVLGKPRPEYWEQKLASVAGDTPVSSLVAEMDGKVVGFIIGGVSRWEYGVPENVGWIDTIGVDPEYQRKGIAKVLFSKMADSLKNVGVDTINTFVTRRDWRLLNFFTHLGFQKGDMTNLEMDI